MTPSAAIEAWRSLLSGTSDRPSWRGDTARRRALLPVADELDLLGVSALVDELAGRGRYIAALAVRKMANATIDSSAPLKKLLSELLAITPREADPSDDPVPSEFLGSHRPAIAWSVLERDRLEIVPNDGDFGRNSWVISTGLDRGPSRLDWAFLWGSDTEVAGKLRPAGRRKVTRRKLELTAAIALLGPAGPRQGATRFTAQVTDLTARGAGLVVVDRFDRLYGLQLVGKKLRLSLGIPGRTEPISTIGEICWTEGDETTRSTQMGVRFLDPPAELQEGVAELIDGRRDVQYLWSLVESHVGRRS